MPTMTNDESEIRRLAHEASGCAGCPDRSGDHGMHCPNCDAAFNAITTALAAEREQHARDVAEARAETWREAAKVAGHAITDKSHDVSDFGLGAKHSARSLLVTLKWRQRKAEARAQALNDSRQGEPARSSGSIAAAAPAEAATAPAPRGGINQVTGEPFKRVVGCPCPDPACSHCNPVAPPPSPVSPTGETRDERACVGLVGGAREALTPARAPGGTPDGAPRLRGPRAEREAATYCYCWTKERPDPCEDSEAGRRCRLAPPASAPGGAPGVETCGRCGGLIYCRDNACWQENLHPCHVCNGTGTGTGTTPAPSTETPTGGR